MGPVRKGASFKNEPGAGLGRRLDPLWIAVSRHPKKAIAIILLLTLFWGMFIFKLRIDPSLESLVVEDSPAKVAYRKFIEQYGSDEFLVLAVREAEGDLFTQENLTRIKTVSDELAALPMVESVESLCTTPIVKRSTDSVDIGPLYENPPDDPVELDRLRKRAVENPLLRGSIISEDAKVCVWFAFPDLRKNDSSSMRMALYDGAKATAERNLAGMEYHLEGIPTVKRFMVKYIERAMLLFGSFSALLIGIVLFFTFGSPRGVLLPGIVVTVALVWTLGIMGATGGVMDTISSLLFVLVVVVGVGDTIHILVHFLEESFRGYDKSEATLKTMRAMFVPCLLTSITTAIGFASLITIQIPPIQRFGIYAATAVLSAFVVSILLAPAILVLLSEPTHRQKRKYDSGILGKSLTKVGAFNQRYTVRIIIGALFILVFSIIGIFRINVETRVSEFFHPWSDIVRGCRFLEKYVTPPVPMEIMLEGEKDAFKNPDTWSALEEMSKEMLNIPLVKRVDSYADVLKEMNWAFGSDGKRELPKTKEAIAQLSLLFEMDGEFVRQRFVSNDFSKAHISLRMLDSSSTDHRQVMQELGRICRKYVPAGIDWELAGGTVVFVSAVDELTAGQVRSLIIALAVITLLIMVIFRSVRIALLSMIPNVLPILVMLGMMGWLGFPLDTNTVMIGPITLGIAVDDTIHYITRFRRERRAGKETIEAMNETLLSTGRALTSTTYILAVGFAITIFSSFRPQSILGGLGAFTILTALAADIILLPAIVLTFMKKKEV